MKAFWNLQHNVWVNVQRTSLGADANIPAALRFGRCPIGCEVRLPSLAERVPALPCRPNDVTLTLPEKGPLKVFVPATAQYLLACMS